MGVSWLKCLTMVLVWNNQTSVDSVSQSNITVRHTIQLFMQGFYLILLNTELYLYSKTNKRLYFLTCLKRAGVEEND